MADVTEVVRTRLDWLWRIDGAPIVAALTRVTGAIGFAEDLAQEALVAALAQWPTEGIPHNPTAWLTTVAKRKAIDSWRREARQQARYQEIARNLPESEDVVWDPVEDDVLRLDFMACHPALLRQAQVALTLRVVAVSPTPMGLASAGGGSSLGSEAVRVRRAWQHHEGWR